MIAPDEIVEVVDADGEVVGTCTRADMRAHNLRHRATYAVVRRSDGAVLAHRRADWKDIWPGRWDLAFGGVAAVGEADEDAVRRELLEEAGVAVTAGQLRPFGRVCFESEETRVLGRVYGVITDGPFTFPDGEVVAHAWVSPAEVRAWAASHVLCADCEAVVVPLVLGWCDTEVAFVTG